MKMDFFYSSHFISALLILILLGLGIHAIAAPAVLKYKYDALGRVVQVEDQINGDRHFHYDPAGNRTQVNIGEDTGVDAPVAEPPGKPANVSLNGPYSPYGGYTSEWSAVSGATEYQIFVSAIGEIQKVVGTKWSHQYEPKWLVACNEHGCGTRHYY